MEISNKHIVLITSGQPSINPRLVKEADSLIDSGYDVTVLYQYWNNWATELDIELLAQKKWKAIRVGGDPKEQSLIYFISRCLHYIGKKLIGLFGMKLGFAELAIKRNTYGLINVAKNIKADCYIAHNLGALPAACKAAKRYRAVCGFDAEDFHRQEVNDNLESIEYKLSKFIEDKYLPLLSYFSASSPKIADAYIEHYPKINPIVLHNTFPKKYIQPSPSHQGSSLKLFWFSQTLGKNRGIEDVIKAMGQFKKQYSNDEQLSLTLLGNFDSNIRSYFLQLARHVDLQSDALQFLHPIHPDEIFNLCNQFDIGLCLEPGFCLNNSMALSNKLFTYLHSGVALVVSETSAQLEFLKQNREIGKSYPIGNIEKLSKILSYYKSHPNELYSAKQNAITLATDRYNWENESKLLLKTLKKLIN